MENPDLDIDITIYENLMPGKSLLALATELFDSCRFLFVFVTKNFDKAPLQSFLGEIATITTLEVQNKKNQTYSSVKRRNLLCLLVTSNYIVKILQLFKG